MTADRKAALILGCIILTEGSWVLLNARNHPSRFLRYAGFPSTGTGLVGWLLAGLVFLVFLAYSTRLRSVREHLLRPSFLKFLAVLLAIAAAFCEECIFRKLLMDSLMRQGYGAWVQVFASALAFGFAHAIWGLIRGSIGAALRVTLATGILGFALAIVYLVSHRILASCVVSHFLINLMAEPGLILAAVKGEMSVSTT